MATVGHGHTVHIFSKLGVIYGPWLEGTGSRNYPVTRFKGYRNWRRVTQMLEKAAKPIAEKSIREHLRAVTR